MAKAIKAKATKKNESFQSVVDGLAAEYKAKATTSPMDIEFVSISDSVERVGGATLLRQSPILRQFEDLSIYAHEDRSDFGRDGKVTGVILDSGEDVKCYYKRADGHTDKVTGEKVATFAMKSSVFAKEEREIMKDFFHEIAHSRNGLAFLQGQEKKADTSTNGAHSKLFKLTALEYFTEDSFITAKEKESDTKTLAKKQNRNVYAQSDINTIRATGWEFQPWLIERLAKFDFDMSVFNVLRTMEVEEPRKGTKTVAVGCLVHHWEVEKNEQELFNARIRHDAQMPSCKHSDHYEEIIRGAIAANAVDNGDNNVTDQLTNFIASIESRLPLYVIEPETKD